MAILSIVSGTGTGTGIGRAVAHALAADGDQVRILGRRADVLEAAAAAINAQFGGERVAALAIDLNDPAAVAELPDRLGSDARVRALVSNAGGTGRSAGRRRGGRALSGLTGRRARHGAGLGGQGRRRAGPLRGQTPCGGETQNP